MTLPHHGGVEPVAGRLIHEDPAAIPARSYTLRAEPGEAGETIARGGLPIAALLELVEVDPRNFDYLTVPRADGTTAYLAASDFAPGAFPEGPALVTVEPAATRFFRPVRDDSDVNAPDNIVTSGGEALQIGIHAGKLLEVEVLASTHSPDPGEAVSFSATNSVPLEGEQVGFEWRFGDGASGRAPTVSHSFAAPGTYEVHVTAIGSLESGGESAPVQIVVGDPPQRGKAGVGSDAGAKPHGPNGRGGGAGDGSGQVAAGDGVGQRGGSGAGTPGGGSGSSAGSPASSASASVAADSSPSGSNTAADGVSAAEAAAGTEDVPPQRSAAAERTVSGVLVADASAPTAMAGGERASVTSGQPSSASAPPSSGSAALPLGLLALAALLGAGALYEWRGSPLGSRW
ncbi:MAG TPA: PKD domain-containing protein [Solirubrobacterales bacterium]|nr:PKD domain-containing protein [Solirubrobacterales bacterium]